MKRISLLLALVLMLSLSSCFGHLDRSGIENFSENHSEYGVCQVFSKNYERDKHAYLEADYHYYGDEGWIPFYVYERALVYYQYDDTTYLLAKKYAMETLSLSQSAVEEYNGYIFYSNLSYCEDDYPHSFRRFAYNDSNCTLIFLGYYIDKNSHLEFENVVTDWGSFLKTHFFEFYDFSK